MSEGEVWQLLFSLSECEVSALFPMTECEVWQLLFSLSECEVWQLFFQCPSEKRDSSFSNVRMWCVTALFSVSECEVWQLFIFSVSECEVRQLFFIFYFFYFILVSECEMWQLPLFLFVFICLRSAMGAVILLLFLCLNVANHSLGFFSSYPVPVLKQSWS